MIRMIVVIMVIMMIRIVLVEPAKHVKKMHWKTQTNLGFDPTCWYFDLERIEIKEAYDSSNACHALSWY